ncbi:adaptor-related protein complex 1, sigma 3 subunit [Columba livia]|uniref:Adaptor-related protein complex 1, sigma 3 subunit n=1 Tax=Columba livia TaxID=8932 RepID=A0A2I0MBD4_COLLI|nr:adaptor-related protein complex 1, sigma 3 subunit [Columba livia]
MLCIHIQASYLALEENGSLLPRSMNSQQASNMFVGLRTSLTPHPNTTPGLEIHFILLFSRQGKLRLQNK